MRRQFAEKGFAKSKKSQKSKVKNGSVEDADADEGEGGLLGQEQ